MCMWRANGHCMVECLAPGCIDAHVLLREVAALRWALNGFKTPCISSSVKGANAWWYVISKGNRLPSLIFWRFSGLTMLALRAALGSDASARAISPIPHVCSTGGTVAVMGAAGISCVCLVCIGAPYTAIQVSSSQAPKRRGGVDVSLGAVGSGP